MPLLDQGARVDRNDTAEKGSGRSADGPEGYRESADGPEGYRESLSRSCGESLGAVGPQSHRISNAGRETSLNER